MNICPGCGTGNPFYHAHDCGQTFGFMRRVGLTDDGLPLVRTYCSPECVAAER